MKHYTLRITLLSDTLIGSGEGHGATVDSDVVFDELGIPYIPAKRVKGCLRDSLTGIFEMFTMAGINAAFDMTIHNGEFQAVRDLFGSKGMQDPAPVYFSDLTIPGYKENRMWLDHIMRRYPGTVSAEAVLNTFTDIRYQTSINEQGVAKDHSLRSSRVIRKNEVFEGDIGIESESIDGEMLIALASENLRSIGTKRTRGFGDVLCELYNGPEKITALKELEAVCRQ